MSKFMLLSKADERVLKSTNVDHGVVKSEKGQSDGSHPSSVNPPLPRGCRPLSHQVAGHRYGQGRLGMLQHMDGSILKPVQPPPRGQREVNFYRKLFDPKCEDPVLLTLRPFLPKFLGMWNPALPLQGSYLKLEDACRRFRNPSILDIKIGRVSYDPDADERKRSIEKAKYPPLSELGFQLLGMRISGPSPNEAIFYDKKYGRSLTKDRILEGLDLFFSGNPAWKKYIVKAFVQRLEMILSWFESQQRYQFYSSSLLLIYEGEFVDGSSDSDEEFIHKYHQLQLPSMQADSYLATVRRFLNKSSEEDRKAINTEPERCAEMESSGGWKETRAEAAAVAEEPSHTSSDNAHEQRDDKVVTVQGPSVHSNTANTTPNGLESGYSSEAESKLSTRRITERHQREFVTSLNRRIQESAREYVKYRFPPEIVDVKMIDFAHVFEEPRRDDSYVFGLQNLILYLKQVLKNL